MEIKFLNNTPKVNLIYHATLFCNWVFHVSPLLLCIMLNMPWCHLNEFEWYNLCRKSFVEHARCFVIEWGMLPVRQFGKTFIYCAMKKKRANQQQIDNKIFSCKTNFTISRVFQWTCIKKFYSWFISTGTARVFYVS